MRLISAHLPDKRNIEDYEKALGRTGELIDDETQGRHIDIMIGVDANATLAEEIHITHDISFTEILST